MLAADVSCRDLTLLLSGAKKARQFINNRFLGDKNGRRKNFRNR